MDLARITGSLTPIGIVTGRLASAGGVTGRLTVPDRITPEEYTGPTTVIPSQSQQILNTRDLFVADDIVIEPIPNNYGLITWNGAVLTVS